MTLLIVIIVAVLMYVMVAYNGMIKMRNQVKEAWSDIDVQLKRRYNLIPNIVETVKGYAAHEEGVFTKVTEARANAINATNVKDQGNAENMLAGALKSLFAVAEAYPDLKANENFMQLQNELVDTEDKIQSARRFYNSIVRDFNTKIQQFPAKIIAQVFAFKSEEFFEIGNEEEKKVVQVSFNKEGTRQGSGEVKKPKAQAPKPEKKNPDQSVDKDMDKGAAASAEANEKPEGATPTAEGGNDDELKPAAGEAPEDKKDGEGQASMPL
jgi:LemA protein